MPKLYEYFGLVVLFYSNEHQPIHVHGKCQGRESKAEIILVNGSISFIRYSDEAGRAPLSASELRVFTELVDAKAQDIVTKWIDYFVLHKSVRSERIKQRLK
ncbi:DUF4160 domain-containing protein [Limnohabitans sp. B9-3]|uniref:DUF4160 domain-containing protein n=1 Tax=Limnohabitans sp. B9-3 TaxID=1100707 RepID=UPI000C1E7C1B|nr:DUF4160 domain-containing protein [Limnohabitans sp. B9-3]PIT71524.1 hypothetical protein B9Z42_15220 [Limnohabitans sp. B9-3]